MGLRSAPPPSAPFAATQSVAQPPSYVATPHHPSVPWSYGALDQEPHPSPPGCASREGSEGGFQNWLQLHFPAVEKAVGEAISGG